MLWNNLQESWREFLIRCYRASAGDQKLTLEWQADAVVQNHNAHNGQSKTGLHFNPASVTEENRRKANCIQLQRYMEKEDVVELLPYILGGMSNEAKLAFANQYLAPAGLTVHLADHDAEDGFDLEAAIDIPSAAAKAFDASIAAAKNPTPQNLEIAEQEAGRAASKFKKLCEKLKGARDKCKNAMNKMRIQGHKKEAKTN
jgi:hypothetical protein